jgi:hypothetical protein
MTVWDIAGSPHTLPGQGKFVLTGKRPKIRPIAVHAFPNTAFFTTKSTKNTKKEKFIRFSS